MGEANLHTSRKHIFIYNTYYDKNEVPPTKRCLRSLCLAPSPEFLDIRDMFGDLGTTKLCCGKAPKASSELIDQDDCRPKDFRNRWTFLAVATLARDVHTVGDHRGKHEAVMGFLC
ncbi:hypothetical protein Tco_0731259 [Tanacetum coccineum]